MVILVPQCHLDQLLGQLVLKLVLLLPGWYKTHQGVIRTIFKLAILEIPQQSATLILFGPLIEMVGVNLDHFHFFLVVGILLYHQ